MEDWLVICEDDRTEGWVWEVRSDFKSPGVAVLTRDDDWEVECSESCTTKADCDDSVSVLEVVFSAGIEGVRCTMVSAEEATLVEGMSEWDVTSVACHVTLIEEEKSPAITCTDE